MEDSPIIAQINIMPFKSPIHTAINYVNLEKKQLKNA